MNGNIDGRRKMSRKKEGRKMRVEERRGTVVVVVVVVVVGGWVVPYQSCSSGCGVRVC